MQKISIGNIVISRVTGITKYGIFVIVDDILTGLVHISEVSDMYVKNLEKFVSIGEMILVKVVNIKDDKLTLSIKDINYRVKKSCLELKKPLLECNHEEYLIFEKKLPEWINEWESKN